ncbi:MAG: N-(5'-phosphoribosyl)anthranilate isomerase [Promethearchaeota archaeon]|nr:MAG: N-(5'-phosphoribosyl)anthranilate isomerase [Candidatus Lokiarchaeota archaeon]
MMEYVKICGLKKYKDIKLCMSYGADAVGFIYNIPTSPRNLETSELLALLNKVDGNVLSVVVLKPRDINEVLYLSEIIKVDYYQIHGSFDKENLAALPIDLSKKIILALKLKHSNFFQVVQLIAKFQEQFFAFLIDNSEGRGNKLNLELTNELLQHFTHAKIILAGGINIHNIETIMQKLKPYGIDVSSALESVKGIKDPNKIRIFLTKIKEFRNKLRK